ncbi:MAG: response regulator transcription factor [Crocinitomicaceae bacterium]
MEKKAIVLIDDHTIVRSGLKVLIEKLGPYSVVGEYESGLSFWEAIPTMARPDLVLMDLNMPEMSGEELVEKLQNTDFDSPILILTLNSDEESIIRLFRQGVRGFLMKNCSAVVLKTAIESILNGGYYHNEFLTLSLTNDVTQKTKTQQEIILEDLTDREQEFLKLVCDQQEFTYDQIADIMSVTARTVDGYRESLFDKLAVKSKTGMVLFVLKHDLLQYL